MSAKNLKDLFQEELKDIYNGESQILKTLPKLIRAAQSEELREALEQHLEETEGQKQRLETIFSNLGLPAKGKTCEGLKGIIEEGDSTLDEVEDAATDAAIVAAAQKVEHYEMATYGTLRTWAEHLGHDDVVNLLQQTLDEEKAADQKLTQIAESFVNEEAEAGEGDEDEGEEYSGRAVGEEEEEEEGVVARGRSDSSSGSSSSGSSRGGSQGTQASRRRDRTATRTTSKKR